MNLDKNISPLTKTAVEAAIKAGIEILEVYYNSDFDIEFKTYNSPLTLADKRAHNVIVEHLSATNIPVLSEEGKTVPFDERKNREIFWLVDPLDGTKEFIKQNNEFTVNIALIKHQTPVAGVVFVPVTKVLYWADENGSFKAQVDEENNLLNEIEKLPVFAEKEKFVIVGSKSHMNRETEDFISSIDTKGKAIEIVSKGSSLKLCMVAEGNADIYPRLGPTMEWDTAAGHAIVKFAGKEVYQFENKKPLIYNKENLLNPWFVVE
jgi:3'(2'), 5'-bisphosphate nucleotidase